MERRESCPGIDAGDRAYMLPSSRSSGRQVGGPFTAPCVPLPLIGAGEPGSAALAALEKVDAAVVLEDGTPRR